MTSNLRLSIKGRIDKAVFKCKTEIIIPNCGCNLSKNDILRVIDYSV